WLEQIVAEKELPAPKQTAETQQPTAPQPKPVAPITPAKPAASVMPVQPPILAPKKAQPLTPGPVIPPVTPASMADADLKKVLNEKPKVQPVDKPAVAAPATASSASAVAAALEHSKKPQFHQSGLANIPQSFFDSDVARPTPAKTETTKPDSPMPAV